MARDTSRATAKAAEPISLRDENVLVAGGAGFVGSSIVRELIEEKANVVVFDNFLHGTKSNIDELKDTIEVVPGDILDEWKLIDTASKFKISYLFNCVGDTYVPTAYDVPKRFFQINVEGTLNLLLACKLLKMKRMLYVSSTEVYGEARSELVDESSTLFPLNTYAVSKLAADRICFTFFHEHQVPAIVARIFNAYGPRESEPYVIPEIIAQLSRGNEVTLGNIKAQRDFTYVEDTARGLIAAMKSNIPNGEAVNVGSGKTYSVEELALLIGKLMGHRKIKIKVSKDRLRRLDINRFCCDNTKLVSHTSWKPQVGIEDGLQRTIDWFRSHGNRWSWEEFTEGTTMYR